MAINTATARDYGVTSSDADVRQAVGPGGEIIYRRVESARPTATMGSLFDWDAVEAANRTSHRGRAPAADSAVWRNPLDVCVSCQVCGRLLKGKRSAERIYCSDHCRQEAERLKELEEAAARRPAAERPARPPKAPKPEKPWIVAEPVEKVCPHCGATFVQQPTRHPRRVKTYCSKQCVRRAANKAKAAERREKRRAAAAIRRAEREKARAERLEAVRQAALAERIARNPPKPCPVCGVMIPFDPRAQRQKTYCSRRCSDRAAYERMVAKRGAKRPGPGWIVSEPVEKACTVCGQTFIQQPTRHPNRIRSYCSPKCAQRAAWLRRRAGVPPVDLKPHPCPICGTEVQPIPNKRGKQPIFCSRKCACHGSYLRTKAARKAARDKAYEKEAFDGQ